MLFQTYSNVQLNTQESYGIGFFDIVYYVQKMQYLKHDLKVRERRVNVPHQTSPTPNTCLLVTCSHLGGGVHREVKFVLLGVVYRESLLQQRCKPRAGAAAETVEQQEPLRTLRILRLLPDLGHTNGRVKSASCQREQHIKIN